MSNIYLLFLLILFKTISSYNNANCIEILTEKNHFDNIYNIQESLQDEEIFILKPGYSNTYFISYKRDTIINFQTESQEKIPINIHGINCNFDINFKGKIINQINLDTYSLEINSINNNITIIPLIDVINGKYKENYEQKSCPLSINSYIIKDKPNLKIENKEENIIYFEPSNFNILNIIYNIKNVTFDSFVALSFELKQKNNFSITVKDISILISNLD